MNENKIHFDAMDIPMFEDYLRENTTLSEKSIITYKGAMVNFYKKDPNLKSLIDYNDFLIRVMGKTKRRGDMYYFALKHFIAFKFPKNASFRAEIEPYLIKPQSRDPKQKKDYLSDEQRLVILNHLEEPKHKIIALILFETGLRIGDVLRLKQKDIILDEKDNIKCLRINVSAKGQKFRTVYIFDHTAISIINKYIETQECYNTTFNLFENNNMSGNTNYLFMYHSLKKKTRNKPEKSEDALIGYYYEKFRKDLIMSKNSNGMYDKNFSTHDFRRCFARDVYRKFTNDIITLQRALGHRRIETTSRYLKYSGEQEIDIFKTMQT